MYILGMIVLTFFAVIGAASFITAISRSISGKDDCFVLVLKDLTENDAEIRVRRAVQLCGELRCEQLICECADDAAVRICEILREKHPIIEISRI